jgi:voltage-gated potassium channel
MSLKHATEASRPSAEEKPEGHDWRARWHEVIFEADTVAGKRFDLVLLVLILLSVLAASLESISALREAYGGWLRAIEWTFTGRFTAEYVARLATVDDAQHCKHCGAKL